MKSYNHQIRTIEDEPPPPVCCRSQCEQQATFECSYRWRAGWKLEREMMARLPLCTRHALRFVERFAVKAAEDVRRET
jgi:hypothetical protein